MPAARPRVTKPVLLRFITQMTVFAEATLNLQGLGTASRALYGPLAVHSSFSHRQLQAGGRTGKAWQHRKDGRRHARSRRRDIMIEHELVGRVEG